MWAWAPVLVVAGAGAGCTGSEACDPAVEECDEADTGHTWEGETGIVRVDWGCCDPGDDRCGRFGRWWFDVLVQGSAGGATLKMRETATLGGAAWTEQHDLPIAVSDEDGWWQERYLELDVVRTTSCASLSECADRWSPGVNTLFACTETPQTESLALQLVVTDDAGADLACYTWGAVAGPASDCEELSR